MAVLSSTDVANYAKAAGFTGNGLIIAIAVARGESGNDPAAVGDTAIANATWGPSIGLWQIRSLNRERGKGTTRDASRLADPAFNARSAFDISNGGQNWRPWTVYTSGRHLRYMSEARIAARAATGEIPPPMLQGDPNYDNGSGALGGLSEFGSALTDPNTWKRFGYSIAGAALIIYALMRFTGADKAVKGAAKVAVDVVAFKGVGTAGKVARAVT